MSRTRSFRRSQRERVISRKKKFIKLAGNYWHFEHEGSLDKGKIHCSCGMCRYSTTHKELIKKKDELLELDFQEQKELSTFIMPEQLCRMFPIWPELKISDLIEGNENETN